LIGAISLEFGDEDEMEGIKMCRSFILKLYEENIDFAELIKKEDNYKDQLMQYYHKIYKDTPYLPVYEVKDIEMVENDKGMMVRKYHITVKNLAGDIVGEGCSMVKKMAEVNAAKAALCYFGVVDGL
jgi:dsRNA-specific ribonuclease